ncbi:MAG: hypothetical protein LBJ15_03065 [Comamonas sp.]|uniref:hypothetical protein n=1 Tax=Comamonas sp. TaxID=34028 RepID=UPI00282012D0|nr:hypothetical protein [Comamonas sp.]MDR0212967.1 hypothetical protein [Comamonas sp.]
MSRPSISSPRFQTALESLLQQRNLLLEQLKQGDKSMLPAKLQLDDAIACLQFCERHRITASAKVLELPETRTRTPSSDYWIMEDHESADRSNWTELSISGQAVHPLPGNLLLDIGLWPLNIES